MTETIMAILLAGMKIFTDERRRHFEGEFSDKLKAVKDAENAHAPDYSDDNLALAREDLDTFLKAYQAEFSSQVSTLNIAKVASEVVAHV